MVANPLQSITAWSLERIDITRRWVSSLVMLCQASTATVFSSCLFLGHFPFSFVFSKWNACSIGFRSGDWLGHCITVHFFPFKNSLVAFAVCFGSLSICTVKRRPMSSEAFGWIWADNIARNTSEFILLLLSAVTSSINTREPVPLAAIHAHAMTLPPPCFTDEVVCLGSWAVPFLLHTLLFPSLWYKLILVSSVHRMLFQNCEGFFRCRLANSNLAFLFLRLTNGLHLVVNPLYSLWWSLLLIVDFDTHTPTSWRVFLIWPTVVKGVFFTRERILRSSTTVVFRGLPGLLVLLSSPVRSFFLRMFQTVVLATPNVFAISLMGLFCFFSLMMACFTDSDSSLDLIFFFFFFFGLSVAQITHVSTYAWLYYHHSQPFFFFFKLNIYIYIFFFLLLFFFSFFFFFIFLFFILIN